MASNYTPSSGDASKPKQKHRYLTVAKKMEVHNMINVENSYAAIAHHFGVTTRANSLIKKAEGRIRKTAEITVNKSAKKLSRPIVNHLS